MDPVGMDTSNANSHASSETAHAPPLVAAEDLAAAVAVVDDVAREVSPIDQSHHPLAVGSIAPHDASQDEEKDTEQQPDTQQGPKLPDAQAVPEVQPPPVIVSQPAEGTLNPEAFLNRTTPDYSSQLEGAGSGVDKGKGKAPAANTFHPPPILWPTPRTTGLRAFLNGSTSNNDFSQPRHAGQNEARWKGKEPVSFAPTPPPALDSPARPSSVPFPGGVALPFLGGVVLPGTGGFTYPTTSTPSSWELDAERPNTKLPIVFKDAIGRTILIPWRKAKHWDDMKMTIDRVFEKIEAANGNLQYHVQNGHYDLCLVGHPIDHGGGMLPPPPAPSTSAAGSSSSTSLPPAPRPPHPSRPTFSILILPEFWDDFIRPGMMVSMSMWPVSQSTRPNRRLNTVVPNAPNLNTVPPPPMPFVGIMEEISLPSRLRLRGKTRMNPGGPVMRRGQE